MVLVAFVKFDEIAAPSPDPDYELAMFLWMCLCIKEFFPAYGVQLELVASEGDECLDEHSQLADALFVAEHGLVEFQGQWSAVDDSLEMRLGERLYHRDRSLLLHEQACQSQPSELSSA